MCRAGLRLPRGDAAPRRLAPRLVLRQLCRQDRRPSQGDAMRRVLVTASRRWADENLIERCLDEVAAALGKFVLVQGDCPTGGDLIAKNWAIRNDYPHDDIPADWDTPCGDDCRHQRRRRSGETYYSCAGHVRNQRMVDKGAELCLAFPLGDPKDSPGTHDCMRRAKKAEIPVIDIGTRKVAYRG